MFPIKSYPCLRVLLSLRLAITSARQTQAFLFTTLVLCAAILAGTPAYGASSKPNANSTSAQHDWKVGVVIPDGQEGISDFNPNVSGVHPDTSGYFTVHPDVKTLLVWLVLYNSKTCEEISPGNWTLNSGSKYGNEYKGYVSGKLSNGDCHAYKFTGDGIYYKWVRDPYATHDKFKATWKADGYSVPVTFYMTLVY
jgi:hypothetical protein